MPFSIRASLAALSVFANLRKTPLLAAFETLLQAAENRLQAAENGLPAAENRLQAAENRLPAAENRLQAAENRLQAAENGQKTRLIEAWAAFTAVLGETAAAGTAAGVSGSAAAGETAAAAGGTAAAETAGTAAAAGGTAAAKTAGTAAAGGQFSFYDAVYALARRDENPWTLAVENGRNVTGGAAKPALLTLLAGHDLETLRQAACFDFSLFKSAFTPYPELARLCAECGEINPESARSAASFSPTEIAADIRQNGAGALSGSVMFRWTEGRLIPAAHPDTVSFACLSGYTEERALILENTRRFLDGGTANNLLLYGDRGTGKSATVKAVCNELARRGLRLVEVRKEDFRTLPALTAALERRGLRFIVFIDDLSFENQDDSFTLLKGLLEGGVESPPANIVIYATSNRRHFVKENFTDRPAGISPANGDVRAFDTMQEQLSLSDRFGLTVIFSSPSQETYLQIAEFLAQKQGVLPIDDAPARAAFRENALKWERWFNGRSPRTAGQFVHWFAKNAGNARFPWD